MKGKKLYSMFYLRILLNQTVLFSFETISDLMTLQDRIDKFQKVVFTSFRMASNNECRIASLVPLVEESYGIYKFITSMLRAMHKSKLWTKGVAKKMALFILIAP